MANTVLQQTSDYVNALSSLVERTQTDSTVRTTTSGKGVQKGTAGELVNSHPTTSVSGAALRRKLEEQRRLEQQLSKRDYEGDVSAGYSDEGDEEEGR